MAIDGNDIVNYAQQFLGTPYVWGGNSLTQGVDCSGLTQQVFQHFGIDIPRVSYDQIGEGSPIGARGLRPGDLVFFDTDPSDSGPDHVGIYMGDGKMIHAPRPGKNVEVADMTSGYYMDRFMGGRRLDKVRTTGSRESDFNPTPKLTPQELAANYGWAYGFLNSVPELKRLFGQAVEDTWTAEKFQAELRDTEWWNNNSDTRRQAQVTRETDPATWQAMMSATMLQVRQIAAEVGAAIPQNRIREIAKNVLETGMDEGGIRNAIGGYVEFSKNGSLSGEAAMHEYTMREFAYNNGVKISDQTILNQAQRVIRGIATTEQYEQQVKDQAISMFPSYEDQINAGINVRDIAEPYVQLMSSELGLPETSVNVFDPQIKKALNGIDGDKKPGGVSLTDFQMQLRNDPRWRETDGARDAVMNVGLNVLKDFGLF